MSVNPIKRAFYPKNWGCQGQYFSLFPTIHTSKFALFPWQTDYCVWSFFCVKFCFCSSRHIMLGCSSLLVVHKPIFTRFWQGAIRIFFTIWVNSLVCEFKTLLRVPRKLFGLNMTSSLFLLWDFLNQPFTHIKSGGYFPNWCITLFITFNYFITKLERISFHFFCLCTKFSVLHIHGIWCI